MSARLLRITTVPTSLQTLLRGQMRFMQTNGLIVSMASANGDGLSDLENREGCRHYVLPLTRQLTPFRDLWAVWVTLRLIWHLRPDIVHTHTPKAGLVGMLAAWLARVPVRLHTVAGLPLMTRQGMFRRVLIWVERLTYACATGVYPNSLALHRFIQDTISRSPKLRVVGHGSSNGINSQHYCKTPALRQAAATLRQTYGLSPDVFVWVFVGRLVRDKGLNELVEAYEQLSRVHSSMHLLLVGPFEETLDPISASTRALIETRADIHVTGFQADVRPFLVMANALVFPSHREGFPNVPMQAACLELPMILTDINGCNEIVTNNENGLLVPPNNVLALTEAMRRLYNDQALQEQFRQRSRHVMLERYDQQKLWYQWLAEYHRHLTQKSIPH